MKQNIIILVFNENEIPEAVKKEMNWLSAYSLEKDKFIELDKVISDLQED